MPVSRAKATPFMRLQRERASIQHGASNLLQAAARVLNGVWKRVFLRRANRSLRPPDGTADPFPPAVRQALDEYRRRARERAAAGHLSLEGIAAVVGEPLVPAGSEAEEHLSQCEECRREYDALRQLIAAVSKLPAVARPKLTEGFEFTLGGELFGAAPDRKLTGTTGSGALEERDLIELAKQREDQACRILYELHSRYLYRVIRHLVGDDDLAEELSQDAWRRIFEKLALFEYRSSFRTWAATVARRVVWNRKRSPPIEPFDESVVEPENDNQPLDRLTIEEAITVALDRLPQVQRAVLLLHDRFGLSHIDIAASLGIDPGTSRSNLHKARARLRKELGGADPREVG